MNGAIGWVKRLESFQIWEGSFETNANPEEALVHAPLPSLETGVEFEGKTRSNYCRKTLEGSRALSGGSDLRWVWREGPLPVLGEVVCGG